MNMLLETLRNLCHYEVKDLARALCISEEEYKQIESGPLELTPEQANALAEIFRATPQSRATHSTVTIYLESDSRTITNVTHYYEQNDKTIKTNRHENESRTPATSPFERFEKSYLHT